jgi:hypothetical protein
MPARLQVAYKNARPHLEAVCEALRTSLRKYIRTHARCQAVLREVREKVKDLAESGLIQLLNQRDWRAIQFVLLTLGKDRGYRLRGVQLGGETVNNLVMIDKVVVNAVPSGEFIGGSGTTIEHESLTGGIVDDVETKKLG